MSLIEVQIDRIVGPTHHFGGLGVGNVASQTNEGSVSNPKSAALQGLDKMRLVGEQLPQFILPPQTRPALGLLQSLGFINADGEVDLQTAQSSDPRVFSASMSCSAMWTANAATVSAAIDGGHGTTAFTVANLNSSLHRDIEANETAAQLRAILPTQFRVNDPLLGGTAMRDEGAANHMRLGDDTERPGIHVFVYGDQDPLPTKHYPRQTLASCQAIARLHKLPPENTFYLRQHPDAIDAGAFHNDVVAASHHNVLLHHELAYMDGEQTIGLISRRYAELYGKDFICISVKNEQLSITDTIKTYLFNSQIISPPKLSKPIILCPAQVEENGHAKQIVESWIADEVFGDAEYLDLRQSMSGGGGPACLRLRVPLNKDELAEMPKQARWTPALDGQLRAIINQQYPEKITLADLVDSDVIEQATKATEAIQRLLTVG